MGYRFSCKFKEPFYRFKGFVKLEWDLALTAFPLYIKMIWFLYNFTCVVLKYNSRILKNPTNEQELHGNELWKMRKKLLLTNVLEVPRYWINFVKRKNFRCASKPLKSFCLFVH